MTDFIPSRTRAAVYILIVPCNLLLLYCVYNIKTYLSFIFPSPTTLLYSIIFAFSMQPPPFEMV